MLTSNIRFVRVERSCLMKYNRDVAQGAGWKTLIHRDCSGNGRRGAASANWKLIIDAARVTTRRPAVSVKPETEESQAGWKTSGVKNFWRFHWKLITGPNIKRDSRKSLLGLYRRLIRAVTFKRLKWEVVVTVAKAQSWQVRGERGRDSTLPLPAYSTLTASNVPSNITMTVIAALINADPAASRQPVTPPGFGAILSALLDRSRRRMCRARRFILCTYTRYRFAISIGLAPLWNL